MVAATLRTTYDFTDPLGSSDPLGTRRRIRHAHGLIYGGAAPSLLIALLFDGGPLSQRIAAGAAMVITAALAIVLLAWRRAPDSLLLAAFPLAALAVTTIAVVDPPLALTPMFYVWPLMSAAYFLRRREALLTYAFVSASFGAASLWAFDSGPRFIQWVTVVIVGAVVVGFVAALKTALTALVERLSALAREDPLTGALNRRAFVERLDAEIARSARFGASCAVAVVDVDHFKDINDRFGHAAGDAALRNLVATVSGRLRRGDVVGRLGGEEFAVALSGADAEGAEAYANMLRGLVAAEAARRGVPFTVSVGVAALVPSATIDAELLLATADAALYRAKRAGRDTVRAA